MVGNAIISEAYLPASEAESIERLRYAAPWLSRTAAASLMASSFPSKVSVLIPTTSPPMDLMVSFNSLSFDNSATQGLQPVNQKFITVTAFLEKRFSSTSFPSKSFPETLLKAMVSSSLESEAPDVSNLLSTSVICSSIPRIVSISSFNVFNSSSVKEFLFDSTVEARYSA